MLTAARNPNFLKYKAANTDNTPLSKMISASNRMGTSLKELNLKRIMTEGMCPAAKTRAEKKVTIQNT